MFRRFLSRLFKKHISPTVLPNEHTSTSKDGSIVVSTEEIVPDKVMMNVLRRYNPEGELLFLRAILRITEVPLNLPWLDTLEGISYATKTETPFLTLLGDIGAVAGTITLKEVRDHEHEKFSFAVNDLVVEGSLLQYTYRFQLVPSSELPLFWFHVFEIFNQDQAFGMAFRYISQNVNQPRYWL
jgi:hypothetical protein